MMMMMPMVTVNMIMTSHVTITTERDNIVSTVCISALSPIPVLYYFRNNIYLSTLVSSMN